MRNICNHLTGKNSRLIFVIIRTSYVMNAEEEDGKYTTNHTLISSLGGNPIMTCRYVAVSATNDNTPKRTNLSLKSSVK
jgi:hypothetical protein